MDSEDTAFRKKREQSINWAKNNLQQQNTSNQLNWIYLIAFIIILVIFIYWYTQKYAIRRPKKEVKGTILESMQAEQQVTPPSSILYSGTPSN